MKKWEGGVDVVTSSATTSSQEKMVLVKSKGG